MTTCQPGEAPSLVALSALPRILVLPIRHQDRLDRMRIPVLRVHLNRPRCADHVNEHDTRYMIAVSVSSSCAKTEGKTCYGCIPRGDQEVRPACTTSMYNMLITVLQRDQADREARFARSCKFPTQPYLVNVDFAPRSSRTIRNCYGRLVSVHMSTSKRLTTFSSL